MASSCSLAATENRCTWCLLNLGSWSQLSRSQLGLLSNFWIASSTDQRCYETQRRKANRNDNSLIHMLDTLSIHCLVLLVLLCQQGLAKQVFTEMGQAELKVCREPEENPGKAMVKSWGWHHGVSETTVSPPLQYAVTGGHLKGLQQQCKYILQQVSSEGLHEEEI